ncbi:DUF4442 domain-containing protein [Aliikangiella maris]|uniref:DUF4442 domain-containing protein n=2 Tax=Aliikangiella maris TaxID=3162458 RepID=A0ABV2BQH6_9GAMM
MKNQLVKIVEKLQSKPKWLRHRLLNIALGSTIRFMGTARIKCEALTQQHAIFYLKNHKKIRNHAGMIHPAALTLLAQTASELLIGMNIPDDKTPQLKQVKMAFEMLTKNQVTARAKISAAQAEQLVCDEQGVIEICVELIDEKEQMPANCWITWAWKTRN